MNNQSPSEVLGNLASIASLNPFSPFTMGLNDVLDMIKSDELSVATGDNPVTKEEVKKAMENSDSIMIDSCSVVTKINNSGFSGAFNVKSKLLGSGKRRTIVEMLREKQHSELRPSVSGGLVKQILQRSRSHVTIWNALSANGYDYFQIKKYLRCRKMSLSQFLGTLSKPQLIEIYNYVDSHMANRVW